VCRSLSEVYSNKKSSLKCLVASFPKSSGGEGPAGIMMALPTTASLGLTREQVMPFLMKMENGQEREGEFVTTVFLLNIKLYCY
jgi:hypothetical protein